jgi:histidyl-tRNA synthetase
MKIEMAKGVKDFSPKEQIIRTDIIKSITENFEKYGFSPMQTPILERYDVLTAKFGAGEETDVIKEIFRLKDQGKRDLGLKFDQTVPLARYMTINPTIKLPFRRYTIDRAFRDGPIKLGRYREFYQCDVDIIGSKTIFAEIELINLSFDIFKELGFEITFEINSRQLLFALMEISKIDKEYYGKAAIAVDKINKIGKKEVLKEMISYGIKKESCEKYLSYLEIKENIFEILEKELEKNKNEEGLKSIKELEEIFSFIDKEKKKNLILNLSLSRGLNYYTGTIFEVFLKNSKITSSVAGGGRYDNMIKQYVGRGEYPAIGIAFGLEPITDAIKDLKKEKISITNLFIIPIKQEKESFKLLDFFRKEGINCETDICKRGISKNLDYANYYKIPYVMFVGEEEIKSKKYKLKDMNSGKEELITKEDILKKISRNK